MQRVFEAKRVFRSNGLAFGQHLEKCFFKKLKCSVFVSIGQGRPMNRLEV